MNVGRRLPCDSRPHLRGPSDIRPTNVGGNMNDPVSRARALALRDLPVVRRVYTFPSPTDAHAQCGRGRRFRSRGRAVSGASEIGLAHDK